MRIANYANVTRLFNPVFDKHPGSAGGEDFSNGYGGFSKFMKMRNMAGCIAMALLLTAIGWSQGQLFDKVLVDFPQNVKVGDQTVPAGHYEVRQLRNSAGGARILIVTTDGGTRYEASGATIPILNNETPSETRVILQHIGQNYYLNKIWISGKDYGYEFPLPAEAKALMEERAEPLTLTATYRAPQPAVVAQAPPPAPEPEPAPPPRAEPEPAPTPPPPPPAPEPQAQTVREPTPAPEPAMPATADDWVLAVAAGGLLAGIGITLLRK